jgi:pyruvate/2-oxoglutarate dehydrogenase complex dihydrolipoamide acyltransferase (E2) component
MITDFVMPKLAMAMNEGTVNEWLVEEGTLVSKGTAIAVVETEKVAYDIESPYEGYIHFLIEAGETVPIEAPIARFASDEEEYRSMVDAGATVETQVEPQVPVEKTVAPKLASASTATGRIKASPLARKMAADRGMDLAHITGTGPGGRIVKRDILAAESMPAPAALQAPVAQSLEPVRIPFRGARASISRRLVESLQTTAQLSAFWEVDITDLLTLRQKFVARQEQLGTRVSVNALLVKALACAAQQVPIANAMIDGDEIVINRHVNVGIATVVPGESEYAPALMVPVIRDVQDKGVVEIDRIMKSLAERARSGELEADDYTGSTITFSTTAGIAPPGNRSTPLLNLPNTTLVGPSTPEEKPVVRNGEIVVRTMMPVSITFDHRVMDGEPASRFGKALYDAIEQPGLMLG